METLSPHFQLKLEPAALPEAVVQTEQARFTILTDRMIRMEWSPTGVFEDRASQAFWFRTQPVPDFSSFRTENGLVIETQYLRLMYKPEGTFTSESLQVELNESGTVWQFGDPDPQNLGGTARTVDGIDGATPLSLGLISRSGWSVVDDSHSLVFNENSWLEPRNALTGQLDLYFLGYEHDYLGCLRDFNLVSGAVPMLPRFVLGNWWSRYWEYRQEELQDLMEDFQAHEVPLSVCIIDMDWHITSTGNDCSGWTGYTWNNDLFPDPEGVLRFLHEKGLKVALNLHPAEGIHRHESMYTEMCESTGIDPATGQPVEFDITNPRFVVAYFRILHHPEEERGVDFWWMDWQQGVLTRLSGLDPLWWLNHLHFLDLGRDGKRRSFVFSRWGGLGNHRYPIGFSGDSIISWASMAFQPYFTATSSNVNYGWWSHDIGGHFGGVEDAELYTRWVQLGVFQPVLRLHSTKNPYHERRPWGFDANTFVAAREALQLRHAMIPYLYSMAWRFHHDSIPPIVPMYYLYPEKDEAYACPNQYFFGDQLITAPFIHPANAETRLSRAVVWLPEGDWYDFFTGEYLPGDGWHARYGTINEIPVFARAGGIIPQGPMAGWDNVGVPNHLIVNIFPGADGAFDLYEDEGNSNEYLDGAYAITPFRQSWKGDTCTFTFGPAEGDTTLLPNQRQLDLRFRGFLQPKTVEVRLNETTIEVEQRYDTKTHTFMLMGMMLSPGDKLEVVLNAGDVGLQNRANIRLETCRKLLRSFRMESWAKAAVDKDLDAILDDPDQLGRYVPQLSNAQARALMEIITGAGIDYTESTGKPLIVVWNNQEDPQVKQLFAMARLHHWWMFPQRYPWNHEALPHFNAYRPLEDFDEGNPWVVQVDYYGVTNVREERR